MNKKIIIILLILATGIFLLINNHLSESRIQNTTPKETDVYINNDQLTVLFNNIMIEEEKNKNIDYNIVDNLKDINTLKEKITTKIEEYDINHFNNFNDNYIKEIITDKDNLDLILATFNQKDFIKNIDKEINKREQYLSYLNNLLVDITYLENNYQDYYFHDNIYICKNTSMLNYLNELKDLYNLDIEIKLGNNNVNIPILLYHGVLDNTWGAATLFVKPEEFAKQMEYLKNNNYTPLFISELDYAYAFEKPIIITFDDGYQDVYTNALPILKKYNLKANVYIITNSIGKDKYMDAEMIKNTDNSGLMEIGSHTINHYKLAEIDLDLAENEIKESKNILENILNKEIYSIAYPSGSFNESIVNIVKKYYQYGLSTRIGHENANDLNTYSLKRYYVYREYDIEAFKKLL